MQMYRQSLRNYGAPLCETVVEAPRPQGTEVLVRVERCGVCHSDLHMQDGYFLLGDGKKLDVQAGRTLPFTLGHEIAGLVESIGPDADVEPGAELAALISSRSFSNLKAPVERVTGFDVPTPAGDLEDEFIPNVDRILYGVQRTLEYRRG